MLTTGQKIADYFRRLTDGDYANDAATAMGHLSPTQILQIAWRYMPAASRQGFHRALIEAGIKAGATWNDAKGRLEIE